MPRKIRKETKEIIPRYYGLSFQGSGNTRIFDNPSTAALAYIAIMSPDREGGLVDMLKEWQARKPRELAGEFGYNPLFSLNASQAKKLLGCRVEELVQIVREAIHRNHGSYNLWDCYGKEAVSDLVLRGETLTAEVRSQAEGRYGINLKGAVRGVNGEIRYTDSSCSCGDNRWTETKGGINITTRRNCLHVKEAELESYMQDTRVQHHARELMREKQAHGGERSLTFNFVDDPFLRHLIADVLIAREVLGESVYSIDRKLLSGVIGPAITHLSLQQEIARGKAFFEILKGKNRTREIDKDLADAQEVIDEAFGGELRKAGYQWQGYCLELGNPACRYEHPEGNAVSLSMEGLPFYVVRDLAQGRVVPLFAQDYAPQNPFMISLIPHRRIDDRTRKETSCYIEPAVRINVPEVQRNLRYNLPSRVIDAYRKAIRKHSSSPETKLKALRIKF